MNDNRKEPSGKSTFRDALLAIDSGVPSSPAEGREFAKEALRRDRRRVRILTGMTIGFFLMMVVGICLSAWFYYARIVPFVHKYQRDISVMKRQLAMQGMELSKPEPQLPMPEPQASTLALLGATAYITMVQGQALLTIQVVTLWGISALLAIMLAAAFCTVLLIMATRRATLRQIQVSLLALSEQFDALQRSLHSGHPAGGAQATQQPGA